MGRGWQLHEILCPKHLVLRGRAHLGTLERHGSSFFLSQLEHLSGFPAEVPDALFA